MVNFFCFVIFPLYIGRNRQNVNLLFPPPAHGSMIEPEQGTTTFSFLINLDSIEISQDQWDRVEGKGEEIKISTTLMMNFVKKENEEWEGGG